MDLQMDRCFGVMAISAPAPNGCVTAVPEFDPSMSTPIFHVVFTKANSITISVEM